MERQEILRRLPEIEKIQDDDIREETIKAIGRYCPEYFWEKPASSSGKYHPNDHCGQHGLWLHTKRAFTSFERLSKSYLEQGLINEKLRDCGRSAILLHDMFKYGKPTEAGGHTVKDHDKLAAQFLDNKTNLPPAVIGCIESHNGPWCEGKSPETPIEQIHHLADMIGSDTNALFKTESPSKEIRRAQLDPQDLDLEIR